MKIAKLAILYSASKYKSNGIRHDSWMMPRLKISSDLVETVQPVQSSGDWSTVQWSADRQTRTVKGDCEV